jgi:hypothetical protein
MALRAFSTLEPIIAASAPGCPTPTIIKYIREAAIDACERTLYWRYRPSDIALTPLQSTYSYPTIVDGVTTLDVDVHAILKAVLVDGPALEPMALDFAVKRFPQWDAVDQASQPQVICQLSTKQYILLPKPEAGSSYDLTLTLVLKPSRVATAMDAVTFNELEDAITHNTLQRLLLMPDQNWSDRDGAAYHMREYMAKLTERRARANLGNMRGPMTVRRAFFGA